MPKQVFAPWTCTESRAIVHVFAHMRDVDDGFVVVFVSALAAPLIALYLVFAAIML
jgi:hypothetical protein